MSSNAALLRRLFAAFAADDLEEINRALAPAARSHTPGDSLLGGTAEGREAVIQKLRRPGELSDGTYEIEVLDILDGERHAAVVYRGTAKRAGRELDLVHVALYEISGAQITEVWFQPLDQDQFDNFWS